MAIRAFTLPALANEPPAHLLEQAVEQVGRALRADRCFLYVRQPGKDRGRIAFCWRKDDSIPDVIQPEWQEDVATLPDEDPLFRAAITLQPSVYVDDVETAPPTILNRDFEHRTFGHRALIHAHVTQEGQLWAILQPCLFGQPRQWTAEDRAFIETVIPSLVEPVKAYVEHGSAPSNQ
jgi:GAF domain-containing protein